MNAEGPDANFGWRISGSTNPKSELGHPKFPEGGACG
jgi:hypothetical protein